MARGTTPQIPTTLLNAALIILSGGIVALILGAAEAAVFGVVTIEFVHQRRVDRAMRRLDVLEAHLARLAQGQVRIYDLSALTKDEIHALAQLERRRIHIERRINGAEQTGPNPRMN